MSPSSKDYAEAIPLADGIAGGVANAFSGVRRICADSFQLFSLEVRRAGLTLAGMIGLGAVAALLVATTWLGLMAALALWVVSLGWTWISAMVAIALINLTIAAISIFTCLTLSRNLLFPATRRQLKVTPIEPQPI